MTELEGPPYGEGFRIDDPAPEDFAEVLEAAVDYRGDVTLTLRDGEELVGYIFNRSDGVDPHLQLFQKDSGDKRSVRYGDIAAITFSGRDTASGKSWETWAKNYEIKKAARARGEDVGQISLDPEPLD